MTEADLLKASGHAPEAIMAYRKRLGLGREEMFPGARLELVAYKLGEALRVQENYSAALEVYGSVSDYPHAEPELVSKATLVAREIYDLLGQRSSAVKKYQELIAVRNDSSESKTARQFLNHPYRIN
jgi:tetratricopeptide (TPR) repeat protein